MVDTYSMERNIESIEEATSDLRSELEDFSSAAGYWGAIEDEGYSDSDEVIEALGIGAEWIDLADRHAVEPSKVDEYIERHVELEESLDVFSVASGLPCNNADEAEAIVDALRGEGKESLSGVTAALKLLIEALQDAEILPRTVIVPAPVNDVEAVNPPFSNEPSTATVVQAADETNNNATT